MKIKSLIIGSIFMLTATLAFSNGDANSAFNKIDDQLVSYNEQTATMTKTMLKLADCTITVTNNKTGDSYNITVHGVSCAELLRSLILK
ncbi:MAG: hypothetical protein JXB00_00920 [Bacteroidales bacterium]|nr:hypothetical protein [Bacteroidales bacterium]